jgi:hypothetical protein
MQAYIVAEQILATGFVPDLIVRYNASHPVRL